jgi:hypothetical protein
MPIIDKFPGGPETVHTYHVLNSLRPWWISQQYLAADRRPVDLTRTAGLLSLTSFLGLFVLTASCQALRPAAPTPLRSLVAGFARIRTCSLISRSLATSATGNRHRLPPREILNDFAPAPGCDGSEPKESLA